MKNLIVRTVVAATLACGIASAATVNKGCSNASLKGTFAYKGIGTIVSPAEVAGPIANVIALTFDGANGITGAGALSQNGAILPMTVTGTYSTNADCTGTYTLQYSLGFSSTFLFVMDDSGAELQIICMDSGVVLAGVARRQFPVGDWRQ